MATKSPEPSPHPGPCLRQQEIISEIQAHLVRLAELSQAVGSALESKNEKMAIELDKEIELELGEKERGMGMLAEHRREHGC